MRKGGDEIEADVFTLIKGIYQDVIKGSFYREGMRPINASTEDAVVTFKGGLDGQFQQGEVAINIYVPNIINPADNRKVKNIARCRVLGAIASEMVSGITSSEYRFWLAAIPKAYKADDVEQYYVNIRLMFSRNAVNH
jgi:hypothetical protein